MFIMTVAITTIGTRGVRTMEFVIHAMCAYSVYTLVHTSINDSVSDENKDTINIGIAQVISFLFTCISLMHVSVRPVPETDIETLNFVFSNFFVFWIGLATSYRQRENCFNFLKKLEETKKHLLTFIL